MNGSMGDTQMTFKAMVDGKEQEFEVLFTFEHAATGKSYIVYTDGSESEDGNVPVYASTFTEMEGEGRLNLAQLETAREWEMIEVILGVLQQTMASGGDAESAVDEAMEALQARWDREDGLAD